MRRSFGPKLGGGGMMKSVHTTMRTGIGGGASQESYSHAATRTTGNRNHQPINTTLSLHRPSSPCSYINHPLPDTPAFTTSSPPNGDEFDWEYVDGGSDGDSVNGFYDDFVFGGVPSVQEVNHAVTSLHEVLEPVSFAQLMKHQETYHTDDDAGLEKILSPTGFELDWREPSMQLCYSTSALQVPRSDKVFDAFHMLQTDPSVQRMVISLSSDKAVWDAVMNNEVVRELRESISEDKSIYDGSEGGVDDSNPVTQVLCWIFANTKDKVIEIVEKITKVVNELLRPTSMDEKPKRDANVGLDSFDEKLRSSFFLSIVVLLIVVVSRSGKQR
ncbi:hypothetical protein HanPI659440_Chr05g0197851 [Helianthus annuus]|uniref:Uncharacterized protein n=1 Tax=Helianthus annuus TaxID=4232 RepID=A0A251URL8_HELAN|nr:uncharacterized protein LOC110940664 isoform X2 [Helianthus annuus]KAF5805576.1 hypothetical protein HanXRQr2_Chr05g0211001 [Helianthus annuus]KAJ0569988.1 hypothetical protein HanHA300_Chr05g0172911 [Helianthus annuus]KAJ0584317.1 hypothetical protein HanHA89_Chr05g0187171 [Helianthus annuus]KAJ0750002.1 hypothetical protein HanLR1_Chr05g0176771 [Helianthus annuus]KAJ0788948.1 hypothetical protein HanPI659440_Chr05g0197851 [Helianthus annuus]